MHLALKRFPFPSMGEGLGRGGARASSPIPTFPRQGGRGIDLPLGAHQGGGELFSSDAHESLPSSALPAGEGAPADICRLSTSYNADLLIIAVLDDDQALFPEV
jgi:hypothetical protein